MARYPGVSNSPGFRWVGIWSSGVQYYPGDALNYGVSSYICVQSHIGQAPSDNSEYWNRLATGTGDVVAQNNLSDLTDPAQARQNIGVPAIVHAHAATDITSGVIAPQFLPVMVPDTGNGGVKGLVPNPPIGSAASNYFLRADGQWSSPSASSDVGTVRGPVTVTDAHLVLWDGTNGKLIKDGGSVSTDSLAFLATETTADKRAGLELGTVATLDTGTTVGTVPVLDAGGKLVIGVIPASILGSLRYQGVWNATTNAPDLTTVPEQGHFYKVSVAGATVLSGVSDWEIGDWVISNGTTWDKIDNTDKVVSVNGRVGAVTLGDTYQPLVAILTSIAELATTGLIERTGVGTTGIVTITNFAKSVLDDVGASDVRTTLGLGNSSVLDTGTSGTTVALGNHDHSTVYQPLDATLTSLSSLGTAADKIAYTTGVDVWAETSVSVAGRSALNASGATGTGNIVYSGSPTLVTPVLGAATGTSWNGYVPESSSNKGAAGGYASLDGTTHVPVVQLPVLVGDSGSGGTAGVVPAPATGDASKVLQGAGTWSSVTGTGNVVRATGPTLVTPSLGAATATSLNGVTISSTTGTLTIANGKTFTASNTVSITGTDGSTLGIGGGGTLGSAAYTESTAYQPVDATLTSLSALGAAGKMAYTTGTDTWAETDVSATGRALLNAGGVSGTGSVVLVTSPTLVTPVLGAATATTLNGLSITSSTGTLTVANGKTLSISNTLTFTGTDGSTLGIGGGGTLGTSAYTNTGTSSGNVPILDTNGKLVTGVIPTALLGALNYQGVWNASTNNPTIPAATSDNKGYVYKVSIAGTTEIDGVSVWSSGDWIVSNGATWDKVDNTENVMTGATAGTAGVAGTVPAPATGYQGRFLRGDATWATIDMPSVFVGADGTDPGVVGTVPAPAATDNVKFLRGDATWQTVDMPSVFVGDSGSGGTVGTVPAPASGDAAANKFLKADGNWTAIPASDLVNDTSPQLGGTLDTNGKAINESRAVAVASATTTDIGAIAGNFVHVTGTTTITGLGTVAAGTRRTLTFDASLTLTHHATALILPTSANITTAAGDSAVFVSEGSGNWRCVGYQRANGDALSLTPIAVDTFVSGVSQTVYSMSRSPVSNQSILVTLNGLRQHVNAYSISGTDLTLSEAPGTGSELEVIHIAAGLAGSIPTMTGANGTVAGTTGGVPAPAATDNTKFLRGDGTWQTVSTSTPGVAGTATGSTITQVMWIPATAWTPDLTNAPSSGTVKTGTNGVLIKTLDFDASVINRAQFMVQMPPSWNATTLTYRVSWNHATGSGNVVWGLRALALSDQDNIDTAWGTAVTVTDNGGTADRLYVSATSSAVTASNTPARSDVLALEVYRVADNGSDTLTVPARLTGVTVWFTVDTLTEG